MSKRKKKQASFDAGYAFGLSKELKDKFINTAVEAGKDPDEELRQLITFYCEE